MSSGHRDGRTIGFFFLIIKYCSIVGSAEARGERGFIFEGIRRWPVINLATLIHRY